ncbi:MAG TPA: hypothetical protein VMV90_09255 [Rectinemataceae bacterium]|nr:hypothetical protein [Rectinemataceae bacterium]
MAENVRAEGGPGSMRMSRVVAVALAAGLAAASCGGKAPELPAVEYRIEMRPSPAGAYESLSVFADVKDQNGSGDIVELRIVEDEARLIWKLSEANWTRKTDGGDTWIGAADLVRSDYSVLPRGEYRVMAIDAAGESVERGFKVEGGFPERAPPSISCAGGKLRTTSAWPETLVLAYDAAGLLLASRPAPSGEASVEEVFGGGIAAKIRELAAYGYDPGARAGYYSQRTDAR